MATKLDPIPPGEILQEDFLKPLGISQNVLARALAINPGRVNDIIRGRRGISADTALRLAAYLGTSAEFWLNLQTRYDLKIAARESGPQIRKSVKRLTSRAA